MATVEGQIDIEIHPGQGYKKKVVIQSSRPVLASKILVGKSPQQALAVIPMLFNICGAAQTRAALASLQQGMQIKTDRATEAARDIIVLAENAKEHLLRIFLDWPKLFSLEMSNANLPYLSSLVPKFQTALFSPGEAFKLDSQLLHHSDNGSEQALSLVHQQITTLEQYLEVHVFCLPCEQWLAMNDIDQLYQWAKQTDALAANSLETICEQGWSSQGAASCPSLPDLESDILSRRLDAENANEFIRYPDWSGLCYETSCYTRQKNHPVIQSLHAEFYSGLITRWVARLTELARIPQQMNALLKPVEADETEIFHHPDEAGVATVEAARGRLIHRAKITGNEITDYQILAPTEWNFHPQGLIKQSLENLIAKDDDELEKLAKLLINTIDPCVGYQLRIH